MKNPYLLLIFATLFWAGNFVLSKAVAAEVPPIGLAFGRWLLAFLVIAPFSWRKCWLDRHRIRQGWKVILLTSFFGIAVFNTFVYIGLQDTSALNSLLLQSFFPVIVAVLSFFLLSERLNKLQVLGILLSFCGTVVLLSRGSISLLFNTGVNSGDLWVLSAVFCYAAYALLLQRRPLIHPLSFLFVTFLLGTIMLLPFFIWEHYALEAVPLNKSVLVTFVYLAIFPSILSYMFFNEAVASIGPSTAGLFSHLVPLFGSLMAVIFLDESFFIYHAAGALLIFSGIFLVIRKNLYGKKSRLKSS
ncbi:MAG: DMT family transporter [Cyclobacteriaceae bacterium]